MKKILKKLINLFFIILILTACNKIKKENEMKNENFKKIEEKSIFEKSKEIKEKEPFKHNPQKDIKQPVEKIPKTKK